MQLLDYLFNGVGLAILLCPLVGWLWGVLAAVWKVLRCSREDDRRALEATQGFERMVLEMHGTGRENAVEHLRNAGRQVLVCLAVVTGILILLNIRVGGPGIWDFWQY